MARWKVGLLFLVPVGDGRGAVGQIVGKHGRDLYYFAIYDLLLPESDARSDLAPACAMAGEEGGPRILLLGLSLDAKLHAGHWRTLGVAAVPRAIPFPAFKEARDTQGSHDVVDHTGVRRRPASPEEIEVLQYRSVVAPVRFEKALRARLGLEPWDRDYDSIVPSAGPGTAELFDR